MLAVAHHDEPVIGHGDAVHRIGELLRRPTLEIPRELLVAGLVAVGTPVALVRAGRGIEHNDAPVAITVGDEQFVGGGIDHHVGGAAEAFGVVRPLRRSRLADAHDELAVAGEFEDVPTGYDVVATQTKLL